MSVSAASSPSGSDDPLASDRTLDVLLADYAATREDQRQALARDVAIVSAGVAVFGAFFYLAAQEREFVAERPLLALALPLAPFLIAQAFVFYLIDSVFRGYYIRSLERAICQHVSVASELGPQIPHPSYGHLAFLATASRYAGPQVRFMFAVAWVAVIALYGGSSLIVLQIIPHPVDRLAAVLAYGMLSAGLLWSLFTTSFRSRAFFVRLFSKYPHLARESLRDVRVPVPVEYRANRAAVRYLLLPRAADLIKWSAFITAFLAASAVSVVRGDFDRAPFFSATVQAALFLLIFEFLVYQARYQWNDLRGAVQDRQHTASVSRRRLPRGAERPSLLVMVLRLLIAAYLIHLFFRGSELLGYAYAVAALPILIAVPYEAMRTISDRRIGADVRPGRPRLIHWAIYIAAGLGFSLRVCLGVLIGVQFEFEAPTLALLFIACLLAGAGEACLIWGIESVAETGGSGRRSSRPHIAVLATYLSDRLDGSGRYRTQRFLKDRDVLRSPWSVLHLTGVVAAAFFGLHVGGFLSSTSPSNPGICALFVLASVMAAAWIKTSDFKESVGVLGIFALSSSALFAVRGGLVAASIPLLPACFVMMNLFDRGSSNIEFSLGARLMLRRARAVGSLFLGKVLRGVFGASAETLFGAIARLRARD